MSRLQMENASHEEVQPTSRATMRMLVMMKMKMKVLNQYVYIAEPEPGLLLLHLDMMTDLSSPNVKRQRPKTAIQTRMLLLLDESLPSYHLLLTILPSARIRMMNHLVQNLQNRKRISKRKLLKRPRPSQKKAKKREAPLSSAKKRKTRRRMMMPRRSLSGNQLALHRQMDRRRRRPQSRRRKSLIATRR